MNVIEGGIKRFLLCIEDLQCLFCPKADFASKLLLVMLPNTNNKIGVSVCNSREVSCLE